MSGVAGYLDLTFPNDGRPADQWEHYNLGLMITVSPPTVISDISVSEPPAYRLLSLSFVAIGAIRLRRRTDGAVGSRANT